jgi:hypothetical protein
MGLLDKVKGALGANVDKATDLVGEHAPKIKDGVDKVAEVVDDKTGRKHSDKIEGVTGKVKGGVDKIVGDGA